MMSKHVRFLVVALTLCVLPGSGLLVSAAPLPSFGSLAAEAASSGPVIHLGADGELDTVHYSPQPGVWVVEMPEATWEASAGFLAAPDLGIERAELTHVEEFGKRLSRLTIWLEEPAQLDVSVEPRGLRLQFALQLAPGAAVAQASSPVVESVEVAVKADGGTVSDVLDVPEATAEVVARQPEVPEPAISRQAHVLAISEGTAFEMASSLLEVVPTRSGDTLVIELKGDGSMIGNAFVLPSPDRLVVDLPGVVNRVQRNLFSVSSGLARQVRVAQNRSNPDPVTRLVVDLTGEVQYRLSATADGAVLSIAGLGAIMASVPVGVDVANGESLDQAEDNEIRNEIKIVSLPGDSGTIAISNELVDPNAETSGDTSEIAIEFATHEGDEVVELDPMPADAVKASTIVEKPAPPAAERSPWVAEPSQLIEQAPAANIVRTQVTPNAAFVTTEVETEEQQFTGQPITLTLKDADIKDVLRTFSELTQLNIVLDPAVSGSVTVELRDVPWDQALDLILRINDLDYILENNVLRVASINKLKKEKEDRALFEKAQEVALPLKTVLKPLSYAKGSDIIALLTGDSYMMSERGTVIEDPRTNTLIIRDVVDRVEGILRLIESLDQPTPQVVIEARIVETTRDFTHELGINWGFDGLMDQDHGNDTGLRFPNEITSFGSANLLRGTHFLGFTFSDILNTFNLDFVLGAAESDGLVKIVSTPRVTTQNLMQASIRSGLQIPIQTVANNTVTVQYVDATLQLQVTPQITAEGTVNLTLMVNKREPVLGASVAGATNAPIFTREAQTQLLVRDGGTTVIAGIYQLQDQESVNIVPGLGKIPIIKYLFRNKGIFKRHDELLIFVTPRIVKY